MDEPLNLLFFLDSRDDVWHVIYDHHVMTLPNKSRIAPP